jgi:hypothetical protein
MTRNVLTAFVQGLLWGFASALPIYLVLQFGVHRFLTDVGGLMVITLMVAAASPLLSLAGAALAAGLIALIVIRARRRRREDPRPRQDRLARLGGFALGAAGLSVLLQRLNLLGVVQ